MNKCILFSCRLLFILILSARKSYGLSSNVKVVLHPIQVTLTNVAYKYNETWFRRLTNPAPRRDYALQNVSCSLCGELAMLTGDSDSGKTTLFKLLLGKEQPSHGTILASIQSATGHNIDPSSMSIPVPIYLELQPDRSDGRVTTKDLLVDGCANFAVAPHVAFSIIDHFCRLLDYSETALQQRREQLSASDNLKLELLLACLASSLGSSTLSQLEAMSSAATINLPAPFLLLDEWLDKETSAVVRRVQQSLDKLADSGAIVCVITHKPERWNLDSIRRLSLRLGRLQPAAPLYHSSQDK
ncbi:hypothetical protein MPSEU_000781400 [Mayamaea pseudoterrestris]|nr:hypothetical protein MPSEU_000781400 [Mayamaea pseudoterrestris]